MGSGQLRRNKPLTSNSAPARSGPLKPGKPLARGNGPKRTGQIARTEGPSRKTALRSSKPMAPGKGPARTGKLKPRSKKMEAVYVERRALVERLLQERQRCEFTHPSGERCNRRSSEIHEVWTRGRSGNTKVAILLEQNLLALCSLCHDWVGANPKAAHQLGYLRHGWEGPPPAPTDDHPEARIPLGQPREPVPCPIPEAA